MNYRNAMGIMLMAEPGRWLGAGKLLYFEQEYCISCYYEVRIWNRPNNLSP